MGLALSAALVNGGTARHQQLDSQANLTRALIMIAVPLGRLFPPLVKPEAVVSMWSAG